MTDVTDRPTFDERFDVFTAIAYRVGFRLLGDREEAREVAQEALARAFARWRKVAGHDEPWVARVATNLAVGRWRERRPTIAACGVEPEHAGGGASLRLSPDASAVLQQFGAPPGGVPIPSDPAAGPMLLPAPVVGIHPC